MSTAYSIRNYSGSVVARGVISPPPPPPKGDNNAAEATVVTVSATIPPGWYKLTLTGPVNRSTQNEMWIGNVTGGSTFVVFRDSPHLPRAPSTVSGACVWRCDLQRELQLLRPEPPAHCACHRLFSPM